MKFAFTVAALMASAQASTTGTMDTTALIQAVTPCYNGLANMGSCSSDFAIMSGVQTGTVQSSQIKAFCSSACFTTLKDTFVAMGECVTEAIKDNWPANTPLPNSTKAVFEKLGGMYGDMLDFMCTYDPAKKQYCMPILQTFSQTFSTAVMGISSAGSLERLCNAMSSMGCCFGSLMNVYSAISVAASGGSNVWESMCPNNSFSEPCLAPGQTESVFVAKLMLNNVKATWLAGLTEDALNKLEAELKEELAAKWGCNAAQISIGDLKAALTSGANLVVLVEGPGQVTLKSTALTEVQLTMIPTEALVDSTKAASASPDSVEAKTLKGEAGATPTSASSRVAASVVVALALAAVA